MSERHGVTTDGPATARPGPTRQGARLLALALAAAVVAASPALSGDLAAGRKKASQCQTCHGIDGLAKIPEAPHIAGESELYLRNQLQAFRSGRRTHPIMSVIAKTLNDEDIADLGAWYSAIKISVELPE